MNRYFQAFLFIFLLSANLQARAQNPSQKADATSKDHLLHKKTICLNMIVKNESHVISRCLESVLPFIDYWVIVDTGSIDGTQQIIKDFMKENNIPGELHERPWVNFGHNREEALILAKSKADYLLFIDADDILSYAPGYKLPDLIYDIYMIEGKAKSLTYHLSSIVKSSLDLHWKDPIHEYIEAKDAKIAAILPRIQYVYIHDGARSKDPNSVRNDIKILKDSLDKSPDNARFMFFLAQSYFSLEEYEESLKYFQKHSESEGNPEEVYWSLLQIANIQCILKSDPSVIEQSFLKAHRFRPSRHEAIYYLANIARQKGDYQKAYDLALKGVKLKSTEDTFAIDSDCYDGLLFEYAACASFLDKYEESIKACNRILKKSQLPNEFIRVTKQLRQHSLEKIRQKKVMEVLNKFSSEETATSNNSP